MRVRPRPSWTDGRPVGSVALWSGVGCLRRGYLRQYDRAVEIGGGGGADRGARVMGQMREEQVRGMRLKGPRRVVDLLRENLRFRGPTRQ